MSKVYAVSGAATPTREPIAAERIIEGAPVTETRLDYECEDKLYAGEWSASVGAWRVNYQEWEFCHLLEGACEIVGDSGETQRYTAGDSFIIEPGFTGVWRVLEPMRKRFVIRLD